MPEELVALAIGRVEQPASRVGRESGHQPRQKIPGGFVVNQVMGKQAGRLVRIGQGGINRSAHPQVCADLVQHRLFSQKAPRSLPVHDIDMGIGLPQALGGLSRCARRVGRQATQPEQRQGRQ